MVASGRRDLRSSRNDSEDASVTRGSPAISARSKENMKNTGSPGKTGDAGAYQARKSGTEELKK